MRGQSSVSSKSAFVFRLTCAQNGSANLPPPIDADVRNIVIDLEHSEDVLRLRGNLMTTERVRFEGLRRVLTPMGPVPSLWVYPHSPGPMPYRVPYPNHTQTLSMPYPFPMTLQNGRGNCFRSHACAEKYPGGGGCGSESDAALRVGLDSLIPYVCHY